MASPELPVVYCDNHLLVVAKPACVPTVPDATGDASLLDLGKEWVRKRYDKSGNVFLGVVQRLDRPVSGVVCFARTSKAARRLTDALRERRVAKTYWGVSSRRPADGAGELHQWLEKDRARNVVVVGKEGEREARLAHTRWRVAEQAADGGDVLLELEPLTGRSHQLRVAARSLGAPLLGDLKYGADRPLSDRSIALHARTLELEHPTRGVRMRFQVPPPAQTWWGFEACAAERGAGARFEELG